MFGLFKKKLSTQDLLLISIKSAVMCKESERQNGGLMTEPAIIESVLQAVASDDSRTLSPTELSVGTSWAMSLLLEGSFVSRLHVRAKRGPIGTFTEQDERDIKRILPQAFR